jgi:hypothetical protein
MRAATRLLRLIRGGEAMLFTQLGGQAALRVEPDQVRRLKAELESIHHEVEHFLKTRGPTMTILPLGADPVSNETAGAFNENSQTAIDATNGFLTQLQNVIHALDDSAKRYEEIDETHAGAYRPDAR